jgi:hypothetical protein
MAQKRNGPVFPPKDPPTASVIGPTLNVGVATPGASPPPPISPQPNSAQAVVPSAWIPKRPNDQPPFMARAD